MKKLLLAFSLLLTSIKCFAQYSPWDNLKLGPHAVGYKLFKQYDNGRNLKPNLNFDGNENEDIAIPVHINMWYPANASKNSKKVLYEEYVFLDWEKNSLKPISEKEKQEARERVRRIAGLSISPALSKEKSDNQLEVILKTSTTAIKNAPNCKGSFPVIIVSTHNGPLHLNILFEYLASLGYVILQLPTVEREISRPLLLLDRINTIEYGVNFAHNLSFVDVDKIGILGQNFDGAAALLYQMKNMRANAVVSMEGWESGLNNMRVVIQSPYYNVNNMRVPFFGLYADDKLIPLSQDVFDTLVYADRFYNVVKDVDHGMFGSLTLLTQAAPEKQISCQYIYESIANFFDAYLKKSAPALAFLKKSAAENGFPDGMMKLEIKKTGLLPIPTNDELTKLFTEGQYDKIIRVLKEAKRLNPYLNNWGSILNNQGYSLLRNQKYPEAISIFRLNTELYSENAGWFDSLAEAYETSGDKENMKKSSQHVLDVLSKQSTLNRNEQSLKETAEKRLKK